MNVYKAKLGDGLVRDAWLVRGKNFKEASAKALTTAEQKAKDYNNTVELQSLEFIGEEA